MAIIQVETLWDAIKGYALSVGTGILLGFYAGCSYQSYKCKALHKRESVVSVLENKVIEYLKSEEQQK